jgi:MoxR-like ATPase
MDQFYMAYEYTPSPGTMFSPITTPIITVDDLTNLQSQASKIQLSTLVRSYISSILIALRLDPRVVSTSISSRAVGDARNLVKVMALRDTSASWTNAESVPEAVMRCVSFRLRIEPEYRASSYEDIVRDVLENVRAPF